MRTVKFICERCMVKKDDVKEVKGSGRMNAFIGIGYNYLCGDCAKSMGR